MVSKIDIVCGFLGAGKTTLINRLLEGAVSPADTVIIENEFGDVSIDDELLADSGMEMRTLASGCICCTLRGNFVDALQQIATTYAPERILIEPTGMASPSDLISICEQVEKTAPVKLNSLISVMNAKNLSRVLRMDIPVFNAQFENVSFVVLSHVEGMEPEKVAEAVTQLHARVGDDVPVVTEGLESIDPLLLLTQAEEAFALRHDETRAALRDAAASTARDGRMEEVDESAGDRDFDDAGDVDDIEHVYEGFETPADVEHEPIRTVEPAFKTKIEPAVGPLKSFVDHIPGAGAVAPDHEHEHDHEHDHEHEHVIDGVSSASFFPTRPLTHEEIDRLIALFEGDDAGMVFRAKGFVREEGVGMMHLEYVMGSEPNVVLTRYGGKAKLVVIGRDLDDAKIEAALA